MDQLSDVRAALQAFDARKVDTHRVMREVVGHDDWYVPARYATATLKRAQLARELALGDEHDATDRLVIFSDAEMARAAHAQGTQLGAYEGGVTGRELFGSLAAGLTRVLINEGAAERDTLQLQGPSFGNAAVWADVTTLERALDQPPPATPELVAMIRRYDSYFIVVHREGGAIVTIQNFPGFTNAGAVFTAPDCLQVFLEASQAVPASLQTGATTGERLLEQLTQLGIDGLVVNPLGPGVTRPLTLDELRRA